MRIVLCYPVQPHHIAQIQAVVPDAEIVDAGQERVDAELPGADIFIGHAKVPVDWRRVVEGGKLKWIQSSAAGLDHCLVPEVIDSDIVVTSAAGLFAPQVAEQTMALLYGSIRRLPVFWQAAGRKEFIRRPTDDLRGKTVGIVGLGGNGRKIAAALAPMDVRIVATDYFPDDKPDHVESLWPADRLADLMGCADIVILTLPLNASTRGIIDREMLAKMPPGGYLINVARGQVVVEADLVEALGSGHLQGAGLDVTEVEPLPVESRLWEMSQVIITPHVGAQSARRVDDTTDLVCENLRRHLRGDPLWNQVDKGLGFAHPTKVWKPGGK
ncbi:D-2-hydroxyacid dehydrogenase [Roseimaritima sediminicola]|uniref:D-2-hydroxyacid dehydrogenase n=1 Tax=Roseimaritima sediminicola TaxID=2662066 RepID=UPI00129830CE|nr:D-2-hydroxyacid dehydrogenase [Roseimaritima sediminicola]